MGEKGPDPARESPPRRGASGIRALFVVALENFRDEELSVPRAILEDRGVSVEVASTSRATARGMLGLAVRPDRTLAEAAAADYDAVVFVGGFGAPSLWDDRLAHALAREAARQGRVVGSICLGGGVPARSGVLRGKRATAYPTAADELRAAGAQYTSAPVEIDGPIVTASGPESAAAFGEALARALGL